MRKNTILVSLALLTSCVSLSSQNNFKYKDPKLSSEARTRDLIGHMTIEEKVGQLLCPLGWEMYEKKGQDVECSDKFKKLVEERNIGMLWAVYRADPWTQKTLETGLNPELAAKAGNAIQRHMMENTRLGIPLFIAEEAPHGHMAIGTTVFPTGIGQAATWNPMLIEEMSNIISKEVRLQGGHISYGPVLDLSRDPRWSRVEEAYGEDPTLSGKMGQAMVKGAGAGDVTKKYTTISTLKHFTAYGVPQGGHNGNVAVVGNRELHQSFLPPFQEAVEAGALSVMTAYNSIDGIPCTSNKYLLTDILKDKWGFKGFTVSDLGSIEGIKGSHHVAETHEEAAMMSINAGLDVDLGGNAFYNLINLIKTGKVDESIIDKAVSRVLMLKFEMGLFENPYVDTKLAKKEIATKSHIALARKVAQESIILLENKDNILPLNKNLKFAIIGPNAHNEYNMLGDYTAPQEMDRITTVLEGITNKVGAKNVEYVKGCAIRDTTNLNIQEAVAAAKKADIAVVVVGGSSARDFKTKYIDTGAAVVSKEAVSDMESGEGFDRSTLDLLGKQIDLLKAIKATGKPMVVIYIQGRPLNMNWAHENANALLTAWYPGQEGGSAIADVLFGDYNPAGRLPISVPKSVGQIPIHYNQRGPWGHDYIEIDSKPLYTFGYGLSYTTFEYTDMKVTKNAKHDYTLNFTVSNTGKYAGDEVAQLYIRDNFASVVQPIKQLKSFERVHLAKGESKVVEMQISEKDLSIIGYDLKPVVETGDFTLMVGASSDDIKLKSTITVE